MVCGALWLLLTGCALAAVGFGWCRFVVCWFPGFYLGIDWCGIVFLGRFLVGR